MRRSISRDRISGMGDLVVIEDHPPYTPIEPFDPNSLFELKSFQASKTTVVPFEEFDVSWLIEPKDQQTVMADYVFSLAEIWGLIADDIPASGKITLATHATTFVRVCVRRKGPGGSGGSVLGDKIAITVDESACKEVEIGADLVDGLVERRLHELTSSESRLRLRKGKEVVSDWGGLDANLNSWGYYFPLEVVMNNYFDADLAVNLVIKLWVKHSRTKSKLAVNIDHSSNMNFHWAEDIASVGSAPIVAKTANALIPLVLECQTKNMETEILSQLDDFLGKIPKQRLVRVRINPEPMEECLVFLMAPFPV